MEEEDLEEKKTFHAFTTRFVTLIFPFSLLLARVITTIRTIWFSDYLIFHIRNTHA